LSSPKVSLAADARGLSMVEGAVMSQELEMSEDRCLVRLAAAVTVSSAAELHKVLIAAIDSGRSIVIDLTETTELDISGIQLLYAARQAAEQAGLSISAPKTPPRQVADAFLEAGLDPFHFAAAKEVE
jgi:anti-anti-sigma regulatory factor